MIIPFLLWLVMFIIIKYILIFYVLACSIGDCSKCLVVGDNVQCDVCNSAFYPAEASGVTKGKCEGNIVMKM